MSRRTATRFSRTFEWAKRNGMPTRVRLGGFCTLHVPFVGRLKVQTLLCSVYLLLPVVSSWEKGVAVE